jgi:hypothetical protein
MKRGVGAGGWESGERAAAADALRAAGTCRRELAAAAAAAMATAVAGKWEWKGDAVRWGGDGGRTFFDGAVAAEIARRGGLAARSWAWEGDVAGCVVLWAARDGVSWSLFVL